MGRVGRDPQGSWSPGQDTPITPLCLVVFTFRTGAGLSLFSDLSLVDIEGMEGVKNTQFSVGCECQSFARKGGKW